MRCLRAQQDDDRPLDARTFAQGIDAVKQGKRDEGIRILRKLSQDFPDSPFAPQALLKTADLIYPVAAWDQVGSASPQAIKEATDLLLPLAQKYRSSKVGGVSEMFTFLPASSCPSRFRL